MDCAQLVEPALVGETHAVYFAETRDRDVIDHAITRIFQQLKNGHERDIELTAREFVGKLRGMIERETFLAPENERPRVQVLNAAGPDVGQRGADVHAQASATALVSGAGAS